MNTVFSFNKSKLTLLLTSFLLLYSSQTLAEQVCDGSTVTTDDDSFVISDDEPGLITHSVTELVWARCAVGQEWNEDDETCDGSAVRLTWQEALNQSDVYELEDKTNWRLPNIKELASIVERNCVAPAFNLTIFANTPENNSFWSSSPNTASGKGDEAWSVSSSNGRLDSREKHQNYYVRMVRYAQ